MTKIPIFRAKKIDSEEYVVGFHHPMTDEENYTHILFNGKDSWKGVLIDETTLAIHFPGMLDSQGNKIFASLNKDGKGGDIVRMESECENYVAEFTQDGLSFYEYLDNKKYKNSSHFKIFSIRDIKVIGIQE